MAKRTPKRIPPQYLKPKTRKWWSLVCSEYDLENHHIRLLTLACTAWDRAQDARETIAEEGQTYVDRFGSPKARPEMKIAGEAGRDFAKFLRELGLDAFNQVTG